MGVEIEHKFLVVGEGWRGFDGIRYRQGYLSINKQSVVRSRVGGGRGFLTIKSSTLGIARSEFEYEIPERDAEEIIDELCGGHIVEKTRYRIPYGKFIWEVDEFHAGNAGLVLAEIELKYVGQSFDRPDWVGREVSNEACYTNAMLAVEPYGTWNASSRDDPSPGM